MTQEDNPIRIYVACLTAYNNGILHGHWINAQQDADDLKQAISVMLKASPIKYAEEWAIHDYEGFEGATVHEYDSMEHVAELAAFIAEHGPLGGALIKHFDDLDDAQKAIREQYAGTYESTAAFAQSMSEETAATIPETLRFYIDYDAMARDMEINDIFTIETGFEEIHIFWSH